MNEPAIILESAIYNQVGVSKDLIGKIHLFTFINTHNVYGKQALFFTNRCLTEEEEEEEELDLRQLHNEDNPKGDSNTVLLFHATMQA